MKKTYTLNNTKEWPGIAREKHDRVKRALKAAFTLPVILISFGVLAILIAEKYWTP